MPTASKLAIQRYKAMTTDVTRGIPNLVLSGVGKNMPGQWVYEEMRREISLVQVKNIMKKFSDFKS